MEISFHQHLFRLIGFWSLFHQPRKCLFNKYCKQIFTPPPLLDFHSFLSILIFLLYKYLTNTLSEGKRKHSNLFLLFRFVFFVIFPHRGRLDSLWSEGICIKDLVSFAAFLTSCSDDKEKVYG